MRWDEPAEDVGYWVQGLRFMGSEQRAHAATILGLMGPAAQAAVPALIEALRDETPTVRRVVHAALTEIGPPARNAVPALVSCLRDRCETIRRRAVQSLSELGPAARTAVPALIEALRDPSIEVRRWVVFTLGEIGPRAMPAVPLLVEALREPNFLFRAITVVALRKIGPDALGELLPALGDADASIRRHIVRLIGEFGGDIAALRLAARDPDPAVREAASGALDRLRARLNASPCTPRCGGS